MSRELALGIDVGTTSTKVVALDRHGAVVALGSAEHGIHGGPGEVEAEAHQWWESLRRALRGMEDLLSTVVVVGLCGNMSSLVLVDPDGNPVRPALLLADSRGADEVRRLPPEVRQEIEQATDNSPGTVFTLAKLLWLARHEPEAIEAADVFLTAKDFIRYRLTGLLGTEPTDAANTLLLDPEVPRWRTGLLDRLGLPPALFPPVHEADALVGTVTAAASEATGLPAGVPVQAGMGDMAAAMLGAREPEPGTVLISLGTSVTTLACLREFRAAWRGRLTHHPLPRGMGSMALGSLITGGLAVNWLRSLAGEAAVREAHSFPDPDLPLVFLPHLAGAGTPDFRPEARGSLFGVEPSTTGVDLARALYEGTAFEIADALALLEGEGIERVQLGGGGVNLVPWVRILTDVLDRPTEVLEQPDSSAVGAARLAWRGMGVHCPVPGQPQRWHPRAAYRAAWRRRRERYTAAREAAFDHYAKQGGKTL